ncbi:hypothetical protein B0H66DRAFT_384272 [Apodospora peruviana]|uniref:Uncharacterized protein n=1 Tax=Apodospora peruviana TaxID=516989 RepID=A0AAE0HUN1_9PEZI|nr:hypothetical protein B0H66DRAFT_384272 [Apodospora peruviana]
MHLVIEQRSWTAVRHLHNECHEPFDFPNRHGCHNISHWTWDTSSQMVISFMYTKPCPPRQLGSWSRTISTTTRDVFTLPPCLVLRSLLPRTLSSYYLKSQQSFPTSRLLYDERAESYIEFAYRRSCTTRTRNSGHALHIGLDIPRHLYYSQLCTLRLLYPALRGSFRRPRHNVNSTLLKTFKTPRVDLLQYSVLFASYSRFKAPKGR